MDAAAAHATATEASKIKAKEAKEDAKRAGDAAQEAKARSAKVL